MLRHCKSSLNRVNSFLFLQFLRRYHAIAIFGLKINTRGLYGKLHDLFMKLVMFQSRGFCAVFYLSRISRLNESSCVNEHICDLAGLRLLAQCGRKCRSYVYYTYNFACRIIFARILQCIFVHVMHFAGGTINLSRL